MCNRFAWLHDRFEKRSPLVLLANQAKIRTQRSTNAIDHVTTVALSSRRLGKNLLPTFYITGKLEDIFDFDRIT